MSILRILAVLSLAGWGFLIGFGHWPTNFIVLPLVPTLPDARLPGGLTGAVIAGVAGLLLMALMRRSLLPCLFIAGALAGALAYWLPPPEGLPSPFQADVLRGGGGFLVGLVVGAIIWWLAIRPLEQRQARAARQHRRSQVIDEKSPAWVTGHDDLREVFEQCAALPRVQHVFEKLKVYWGYPEFFEYIDSLLTMEDGRESRRGFDADVYQDLAMVRQYFVDNVERVMAPELTEADRLKIRRRIQRYA